MVLDIFVPLIVTTVTDSECKTSTSAPRKYPSDLQQHIGRLRKWVVRCCWTSDFCSCNVGLVGMRSLHCRSRTCSHMLHQVAIVFPSSVKTGRSPSSSTPTIVAFVPPGMTSWHDDTTCKKLQAPNPIHVLHEKFRHLHVLGCARACVSHTLLWDWGPWQTSGILPPRCCHTPRSCVSQRHMPKCLAAPNPTTKHRKICIEHSQVRRVRQVGLGPSIQPAR